MTSGKGQGQRGWWGEGGGGGPAAGGGRGRRDRAEREAVEMQGWRQEGQRGCRDRKRTRARAGQIPDMKQAERRPETAEVQRERQREMPREGEIGSERTEVGGVGGTETGVRVGTGEREEGAGVWRAQRRRRRHGHR